MARCGNARARDRRHRRVPSPDHRNASLWHLPSGVRQRTPDARGRRCEVSRSCPSQSPPYYLKDANPHGVCATGGSFVAHIDHGYAVGVANEAHFVARQFRYLGQYTRCNSKLKAPDCARSPARARTALPQEAPVAPRGAGQVTYCAMPPPNDQFSFATSTRLITTSSARTFNCACMSSTMRL